MKKKTKKPALPRAPLPRQREKVHSGRRRPAPPMPDWRRGDE